MTTLTPVGELTTVPAPVRRIKTLAFVASAVGVTSMIVALVSYGGSLSLISGLVGTAVYIYLAFQVAARKEWARILIGVLAILGVLMDLGTVVSVLALMTLLKQSGGNSAVHVLGAILALAGAGILVGIAVSAFHREAAAWCRPAPSRFL